MSAFRKKLLKESKIKNAGLMSEVPDTTYFTTPVPLMNVALSGKFHGGLSKGVIIIAGKSKHFKTLFGLIMLKAWFDANIDDEDATCVFYDTEDGASLDYFEMQGIDTSKVIRKYVSSVEEMKIDIANVLESVEESDNICFFWDSLGNVASKKEYKDAVDGNDKVDMTRAKQIKSLARVITIPLLTKKIPMIVIGHTYDTLETYSKPVVSGGTGPYYLADTIWIIGRQQSKDTSKKLDGWDFIINIEKSRSVKEKSKFPISVKFDGGVDNWSGLLDVAVLLGYVHRPTAQKFVRVCLENNASENVTDEDATKEYKRKDTNCAEFWGPILEYTNFKEDMENNYLLVPKTKKSEDV